ncbi:proline-rich protein 36-like isoform X1 [Amphibalanus amphitrite]|uniref:proline-rich protein 36-like isoform X1 n=1 Tax=Amphibalanus amphitrite TaxID=1232801 RepID=UPI001C9270E3|nr:proline-rich protein 36-like isoform X1 [Amphibalanus amphitrite]XP_043237460.1 proline-rich protein 36-like isoform X1 [Amphibalanus amphitrite]XP_043237461.1 proline-rich protein 36-like isoform X1 [Amphibalanus amphitrite]XP_043237462.1 proline-rich protein 36-like isoform X1 [Amphibalanus amphitrite]
MPGKIDAVGFLIKAMVERDPSKRRVKPSQQALEEFEGMTLEDSSDDSDYKVDEKDEDDDGDSNFSGDDDDDDDGDADKDKEEESDSDESGGEDEGDGEEADVSVSELLSRAARDAPAGSKVPVKRIKVCSICLGDRSSDQNEIVECDSCHVTVHEGCNGISESHSSGSSASSDPTEPWFCDACRAGATRFECDLCPNTGGLLKETDAGRWVHLVCALYVPGVAFSDVDRLTGVTLFEIPYTRWGSKVCSVCEDASLARTGVAIQCDAGMCKATFHVTCAQRSGLLQEPRIDEEAADPYFAHCKQHTDKTQIRDRKRNFLAMRLYQRGEHPHKMEPARLQRKLGRVQQKYRDTALTRKPKWTPSMKLPRPVASSPYLLRCLQRRAALMGVDLEQENQAAAAQVTDVSRKWHLPPAFSMEFVSYFLDRSHRMTSMSRSLKELMNEKAALQRQENTLRESYAQMEASLSELRQAGEQLRSTGLLLHRQLAALAGDKLKLPSVLQQARVRKTSAGRASPLKPSPTKLAGHRPGSRLTMHECIECGSSSEQHLLALCDTCHHHYHLACLDPPLTRMPRKSKTTGWECWRCAAVSSRAQSPDPLPDAPRGTRNRRSRQAAAVNMQPQVKLETHLGLERPAPTTPRRSLSVSAATTPASAIGNDGTPKKKPVRSVYLRKDIKHPGVGRGNAPRAKRKLAAAAAAGVTPVAAREPVSAPAAAAAATAAAAGNAADPAGQPPLKTNVRLGVRDAITVDDRRISQVMAKSEAACSSVVVIEKLNDAMVSQREPPTSPTAKRRRSRTESPAAAAAAPNSASTGAVTNASATAAAATDGGATAPAAGSGSGAALSPGRPRRYSSIESTIDGILEQVSADPSGGPPTPPPFVYSGRGRPPTLEPLKIKRRGRPPKSPRVEPTPHSPVAPEAPALTESVAAVAVATAAAVDTAPRRGRPPGSRGRGRRVSVPGARPLGRPPAAAAAGGPPAVATPGRPPATATPGRPRGRPPGRPFSVRTPGRPRGGGARRRTKAQIEALNQFLARRRAERQSQSEASSAEGGATGSAPPPPPSRNGEHPPPAAAADGAEPPPAAAATLARPTPAKRPRFKPGPKERARLKAARAAAGDGPAGGPAGATGPPLKKPRRRRRTKAEMEAARLLEAQKDGAEPLPVPAVDAEPVPAPAVAAEGPGAAADGPSAAAPAAGLPSPSSSGRPARQRRTKAEMQLYQEQVLALKQARERHQQQRQKVLARRRRSSGGHVVEVMTDMKIKIRPVVSEAGPATAPPPVAAAAAVVCSNCELAGSAATTVRCDNCGSCYHFSCLVPPVSKTPKRLGYGWLCGNCSGRGRPPAKAFKAEPPSAPAAAAAPDAAVPAPAAAPASAPPSVPDPVPTQDKAPAEAPVDAPVPAKEPAPQSCPPPPPPPPPSAPPSAEPAGVEAERQPQQQRRETTAQPSATPAAEAKVDPPPVTE